MIAHLSGTLARLESTFVVLDVGGVGYKVSVPVSVLTRFAVGSQAALHIHMHVRAEEISLYGFAEANDQRVFDLLLGVTGIGPKVALSMLSAMDADTLARAVVGEDAKTLVRIPGLGLKTAQRLILEMKDKMSALLFERKVDASQAKSARSGPEDILDDVVDGLVNLGYNKNDARKAGEAALQASADKSNIGLALRGALNILTGTGSKG